MYLPLHTVKKPSDFDALVEPNKASVGDYLFIEDSPNTIVSIAVVLSVRPKMLECALVKPSRHELLGDRYDKFSIYRNGKKMQGGRVIDARLAPADHKTLVAYLGRIKLTCQRWRLQRATDTGFDLGSVYSPARREHIYFSQGIFHLNAEEIQEAYDHFKAFIRLVEKGYSRKPDTDNKPFPNGNEWVRLAHSED